MTNNGALDITPFVWLLLLATVVTLAARRFNAPYAVALVITGLLVGAPRLLPELRLDPKILFTVFLPPLLFESALNLRLEPLRRDAWPIALYALAGTLIATFVVGGITAWALHIPLAHALVFGALISATDPISVIAIFKRLGAGPRLSLLMEAESLFNDGVAVVLFGVTMAAAMGGSVSLAEGLWQFVRMTVGGAAVGAALGWLAWRVHHRIDDHLVEISLTTLVAYGSYLWAEAFHISGVIAVVAAGLVVGNFGMRKGMSPVTQLEVASFWEYAAFLANSIVFLLVGTEAALVRWWAHLELALVAVLAVLVARAAIYPLSFLVNRFGGDVPLAWQHVLFWGGLRGALSLALALGLPREFPYRDQFVAAAFGVVLFSLLVQGLTVGPLLRRLGLAQSRTLQSEYRRLASERMACQAALQELERLWVQEAFPNWSIQALVAEYRERWEELGRQIEGLHIEDLARDQEQDAELRRLALLTEKSMLQEAERRGWLDEEDWRNLVQRIDTQLVALQEGRDTT
jgi:CPA1 family monovalent cation:H+ antiporter